MADYLFYVTAAFTVFCALGVVVNRNAVNSALCLLLSLVGVSVLFALLDAYLLAVLLVLVYAGAVVALFLFIIMLLDVRAEQRRPFKILSLIASLAGFALMLCGVSAIVTRGELAAHPAPSGAAPIGSVLKSYADLLFTTYLLPVEIMGFLLLIAMLGVIVLCKKFEGLEDVK